MQTILIPLNIYFVVCVLFWNNIDTDTGAPIIEPMVKYWMATLQIASIAFLVFLCQNQKFKGQESSY